MPHPPGRLRLIVLLVWGMVAGTVLYAAFPLLAVAVMADLELTPVSFGASLLVYSAFSAALSPYGGRLADLLGGRRALAVTLALTSVGYLGIYLSPTLAWVGMAAAFISAGQAIMNPATNKLIAQHADVGSRGVITGVKQSGVYVGYVLVGAVAPPMAALWGWRSVFLGLSALMVVGAVATVGLLPRGPSPATAEWQTRAPIDPRVTTLAWYGALMGLGSSSWTFVPLFAETELGYSARVTGLLAVFLGVMAIATRIGGARLAERRGHFRAVLVTLGLLGAAYAVTALSAGELRWAIWPAMVLFAASFSAWNAVGMLAVISISSPEAAGAATGRVLLGFLGGLAAGPVVFGWLIEGAGYGSVWLLVFAAAMTAAFVARRWRHVEA